VLWDLGYSDEKMESRQMGVPGKKSVGLRESWLEVGSRKLGVSERKHVGLKS